MSHKEVLTDRRLKSLKPAPDGKRYIVWDAMQPHLAVRVTDKGAKSFVVVKRRAGAQLIYYGLGAYPAISLANARSAARDALQTLSEGKSPKEVRREEALADLRRQSHTISSTVETFIAWEAGLELRSAHETASVLRRDFLGQEAARTKNGSNWVNGNQPVWRNRPITEITRADVKARLEEIKARRGKYAARHALAAVRKLFNWAVDSERFGLLVSPVDRVKDKTLGIKLNDLKRNRVLNDAELRDVWRAADVLGYPSGKLVQMLMLTGQRLNDIAQARRGEVNLKAGTLTVPAERYKTGVAQVVPLTDKSLKILAALPKFQKDFLFTFSAGLRPAGGHFRLKEKFDRAIAAHRKTELREAMPSWVLHDLRRTVRTRLGDLGVDAFIAERVLGHALPGLHGVYDQGTHIEQKREALQKWEWLLLSIVEPQGATKANVIAMKKGKR